MPSRRCRRTPEYISRHRKPVKLSPGRSDRPSVERFDCARPAAEAWGATTPWSAEAHQEPKLLGVSPDLVDGYRRRASDPVCRPKPHRGGEMCPRFPPDEGECRRLLWPKPGP
jgi:hypothetical protein